MDALVRLRDEIVWIAFGIDNVEQYASVHCCLDCTTPLAIPQVTKTLEIELERLICSCIQIH
jgi:hypothetical protein